MAEERDFTMARLGAARAYAAAIGQNIDECLSLFVEPDEDKGGETRGELLESLSEFAGLLSRAIEAAQTGLEGINKQELQEGEPDLPEGDEFDEDDEDESSAA